MLSVILTEFLTLLIPHVCAFSRKTATTHTQPYPPSLNSSGGAAAAAADVSPGESVSAGASAGGFSCGPCVCVVDSTIFSIARRDRATSLVFTWSQQDHRRVLKKVVRFKPRDFRPNAYLRIGVEAGRFPGLYKQTRDDWVFIKPFIYNSRWIGWCSGGFGGGRWRVVKREGPNLVDIKKSIRHQGRNPQAAISKYQTGYRATRL